MSEAFADSLFASSRHLLPVGQLQLWWLLLRNLIDIYLGAGQQCSALHGVCDCRDSLHSWRLICLFARSQAVAYCIHFLHVRGNRSLGLVEKCFIRRLDIQVQHCIFPSVAIAVPLPQAILQDDWFMKRLFALIQAC